jgi:hypothetical protein
MCASGDRTEDVSAAPDLTFTAPQRLQNSLVPQSVLATLHYQGEPVVDALLGLLLHSQCKEDHHENRIHKPTKKLAGKKLTHLLINEIAVNAHTR